MINDIKNSNLIKYHYYNITLTLFCIEALFAPLQLVAIENILGNEAFALEEQMLHILQLFQYILKDLPAF